MTAFVNRMIRKSLGSSRQDRSKGGQIGAQ